MKKTLLSIALVIGLISATSVVNAQNGRFSVGAELALPMGDLADATSMGFGGSIRYEYPVSDNIGVMGTVGYLMLGGKDEGPDWSMIPFQVGGKYYFVDNQEGFYAGLEVGLHNTSIDIEGAESSTDLSYDPLVGYHLANLDIGVKYQMITAKNEFTDESVTNSYLGIRIAYVFGEK